LVYGVVNGVFMPKYSLFPLVVFLFFLSACNTVIPEKLAADTHWKSHTLPNGLNYHFYYKKGEPVEIRLLIHTGSVQETEKQSGYAHFLEHMAFNGSQHFSGNSMVAEFAKAGMEFGPDINAYTTYDLTSYRLSLPAPSHMDRALTWFRDIGDGLNLEKTQIEAEKGVVLGEMRISRPKEKPLGEQIYDFLIKDTMLARHDVLGSKDSITLLDPKQLKAFYQTWYAPNNADLVIVGDFDQTKTERLITGKFSDWKAKVFDHKTVVNIPFSKDRSPQFMVLPEGSLSVISLNLPVGSSHYETLEDQRKGLQNTLMNKLITQRLRHRALEQKIEYSNVEADIENIENIQYNYIDMEFSEEKRTEIQHFLATELANLRDHGINQSELSTALTSYKTDLENVEADWRQQTSQDIIEHKEYALHYNEVYQSMEDYKHNLARFIQEIDVKTLNQQLHQELSSNKLAATYALASEKAKKLNTEQWLAETDRQFSSALAQAGDEVTIQKSIEHFPTPEDSGKIISSGVDQQSKLYKWALGNGIEVWFKRMPKAENNVYIQYVAEGGDPLLPKELKPAMDLSYPSFMRSGLGDMDAVQLNDFLTRHNTTLYPEIREDQRSLSITTTQKNLTTAFAVLHEAATNATVDQTQFPTVQNSLIEERKAFLDSPRGQYVVAINAALYGQNNVERPASVEELRAVSPEQVNNVYQKLFRQKDAFKLIIVADMEPKSIESYLRQYVANITYLPGKLTTRPIHLRTGEESVTVNASNEPTVVSLTIFSSVGHHMTTKKLFTFDLLQKILELRLTTQLREEKGLDYSPAVDFIESKTSDITTFYFSMTVKPEDKEKADQAINDLIAGMNKGVSQEELTTAKSQLLTEFKKNKDDPETQVSVLKLYIPSGYDITAYSNPKPFLSKLTIQDVNQAWQALTNSQAHRVNAYLAQK
jgi:zinc protease